MAQACLTQRIISKEKPSGIGIPRKLSNIMAGLNFASENCARAHTELMRRDLVLGTAQMLGTTRYKYEFAYLPRNVLVIFSI